MLPSMHRQTQELEQQEAMRRSRGERISMCQNRQLHGQRGTGDAVQERLRQQREAKVGRIRHQTVTETFTS
jgi:hypothetical protein